MTNNSHNILLHTVYPNSQKMYLITHIEFGVVDVRTNMIAINIHGATKDSLLQLSSHLP